MTELTDTARAALIEMITDTRAAAHRTSNPVQWAAADYHRARVHGMLALICEIYGPDIMGEISEAAVPYVGDDARGK
jgi:hypothetical protein